MKQRYDLSTGSDQRTTDRGHQGVEPTFLTHGDTSTEQSARRAAEAVTVAHGAHELGVVVARRHPLQLEERRRPQDAVDGQRRVALEVGQGLGGALAEDAVHPARVETQGGQTSLQVSDVVAAQHGPAQIEETVAQAHARLDQCGPGLGAADAVDAQSPAVLETLDGGLGPGPEDALGVGKGGQLDERQPPLQVSDGLALFPQGQGQAVARLYRYACSSWRSCALPRAPMMRCTGSPSLNRSKVGMLITS